MNENIDVFESILGAKITPEKLWNAVLKSPDIYDALGKSQILYGILFGFGSENAKGYYDKFEIGIPLRAEAKSFNNDPSGLYLLPTPYFVFFNQNKQSEALRKQYQKEREKILLIYSKGDFLEITLKQLLSNNSLISSE